LAWIIGFGVFALASSLGGRAGVAVAGGYSAFVGGYCLLNFRACREAHCAVTGPGFAAAGLLGLTAAAWPGPVLSWYSVRLEAIAFLAILVGGCIFERTLAGHVGQRSSC
jgi:hypothetical protein